MEESKKWEDLSLEEKVNEHTRVLGELYKSMAIVLEGMQNIAIGSARHIEQSKRLAEMLKSLLR